VVTVHDLTCVRFPELCTADTLEYPGLIRRAVDRGAWVHTPSRAVAEEVTTLLAVPAERVRAVANGANLLPPADAADGHRLAGAVRYVLGLGTIEPRKDFPTLVDAFSLLAADDPELHLVIAGPDGWGVVALEQAIARSAAPERIHRLGWVDTPARSALLAGAEVLAFASRYEGFGLPVLEAHGLGTPVVASDVAALREVAGTAAVFAPVGEPDALATAIQSVLTDATTADALRRAGFVNVTRFPWESCVDGLVELYTDAVTAHG
jgi:glycosyltransferase involved in cell wall biosynthesis